MLVNCGRRVSGRSNRWVPGWSEGICWAPEVSQAADKVTVTACGPAWSEFSQNRACPLAISAPPTCQPAGSATMQGTIAAEGTAWAARIIDGPVPQLGALTPRLLGPGMKAVTVTYTAAAVTASVAVARATRRVDQRCRMIGGR